ncbi:MAG: Hsp20 family protein [Actinobacteria bacterium]|nr:Hsp20 family protein [Actinomycetota bacterium]
MAPKGNTFYSISNVFDTLMDTFNTMDKDFYVEIPATSTAGEFPYPSHWQEPHRVMPPRQPTTLDDLIRLTRESGLEGADVFERAKEVYRDMPSFPATDVSVDRNNGDLYFDIALPGYAEEDLEISFENDHMNITVAKDNALSKEKQERKEDRVLIRTGLKASKVQVSVPVPSSRFRVKDAEASYVNGILKIKIPRQEDHQPHRISLGAPKPVGSMEN